MAAVLACAERSRGPQGKREARDLALAASAAASFSACLVSFAESFSLTTTAVVEAVVVFLLLALMEFLTDPPLSWRLTKKGTKSFLRLRRRPGFVHSNRSSTHLEEEVG
jgi:hypothetical protein